MAKKKAAKKAVKKAAPKKAAKKASEKKETYADLFYGVAGAEFGNLADAFLKNDAKFTLGQLHEELDNALMQLSEIIEEHGEAKMLGGIVDNG